MRKTLLSLIIASCFLVSLPGQDTLATRQMKWAGLLKAENAIQTSSLTMTITPKYGNWTIFDRSLEDIGEDAPTFPLFSWSLDTTGLKPITLTFQIDGPLRKITDESVSESDYLDYTLHLLQEPTTGSYSYSNSSREYDSSYRRSNSATVLSGYFSYFYYSYYITDKYDITDKVDGASAGGSGFTASVGSANGAGRQVAIRFTPTISNKDARYTHKLLTRAGTANVTLADDSWKRKSGLYRSVVTITVTEGS